MTGVQTCALPISNEWCNYLQSVLGIFFHSMSVPEKVIEMLAHAGLSISLSSIHNAVKSLSRDAGWKLKEAVCTLQTAFAYNNFDINFKFSEPTVEHPATFVSTTSATAIPLYGVRDLGVLQCSAQLWEKDTKNPSPSSIPVKLNVDDLSGLHAQSST